jgi:hypothetical protein
MNQVPLAPLFNTQEIRVAHDQTPSLVRALGRTDEQDLEKRLPLGLSSTLEQLLRANLCLVFVYFSANALASFLFLFKAKVFVFLHQNGNFFRFCFYLGDRAAINFFNKRRARAQLTFFSRKLRSDNPSNQRQKFSILRPDFLFKLANSI